MAYEHCRPLAYLLACSIAATSACDSPEPSPSVPRDEPNATSPTTDASAPLDAGVADARAPIETDGAPPPSADAGPRPEAGPLVFPGIGTVPIAFDSPLDPTKRYRLALVFAQFNDDFAPPLVDVVYDEPFAPTSTSISIPPISGASAANLLCARAGAVKGQPPGPCDASSTYKVGIGYVMIVEDVNANGRADFSVSGKDGSAKPVAPDVTAKIALGALIYDETGGSRFPSPPSGAQPPLIVDPVPKGITLYESYKPGTSFDVLRPRTGPLLFTLRGPNLT